MFYALGGEALPDVQFRYRAGVGRKKFGTFSGFASLLSLTQAFNICSEG
jgi:hypothetical protein